MTKYVGYTDGSADNCGDRSGGWAFVIEFSGFQIQKAGYTKDTTNNRMEIMAVLELLKYVKDNFNDANNNLTVVSDSQYVVNSATDWIFKWEKNGWKTKTGPVQNFDLWKELIPLIREMNPKFSWVKGHSGNSQNSLCDSLANKARTEEIKILRRAKILC